MEEDRHENMPLTIALWSQLRDCAGNFVKSECFVKGKLNLSVGNETNYFLN